jgi:hypothetical protein
LPDFAINDSASTLGSGYTPFYADRGQHPRRPLLLAAPCRRTRRRWRRGDGGAAARLLAQVTGEARALLQERQDRRKAELDAHLRDLSFAVTVGEEVLLDTAGTHPSAVAIAALAALDGPLQDARMPSAQHLPPGHSFLLAGV